MKKSDKLLRFTLDDGTGTDRQILSGVHKFYEPEELVGKTLAAIVNLPPRKMMGLESNGMLLSAVHTEKGEEKLNLIMLDDQIPAGSNCADYLGGGLVPPPNHLPPVCGLVNVPKALRSKYFCQAHVLTKMISIFPCGTQSIFIRVSFVRQKSPLPRAGKGSPSRNASTNII